MSIRPYSINFGSIGSEIDALFAEMENRASCLISDAKETSLSEKVKSTGLSVFGNDISVDIYENETEVSIITDLPGVEKKDITVRLIDPQTLLIKTEESSEIEKTDEEGTYYLRERKLGSMQRNVHLPSPVIAEGAKASFKNGVMEITLQKDKKEIGIPIKVQ